MIQASTRGQDLYLGKNIGLAFFLGGIDSHPARAKQAKAIAEFFNINGRVQVTDKNGL